MPKILLRIINFFLALRADLDFLFLIIVATLFFLPSFRPEVIPFHDTLECFACYYYTYNELFFNHQLPQWLPYGSCGIPSTFFQLRDLTPFSFLSMAIGMVFQIKHVLVLYKCSVFMEYIFFLWGTFKLSRLIYTKRSTVFFVGLTAIGSFVWMGEVGFNFHFYYFVPFIAYLWLRSHLEKNGTYFWMGFLVFCISIMGGLYFSPIIFWTLVFFLVVLLFKQPLKHLIYPKKICFALMAVSGVLLVLYGLQLHGALSQIDVLAGGRDIEGKNTFENFVAHGGVAEFPKVIQTAFLGYPLRWPFGGPFGNTFYMGVLSAICVVLGLIFNRRRYFLLFFIPAVILILFSLGGFVAKILYYFPGVSLYRHLCLVYGLVKFLLIMSAGFGFEFLCAQKLRNKFLLIGATVALYFLILTQIIHPKPVAFTDALFSLFWKDRFLLGEFSDFWLTFSMVLLAAMIAFIVKFLADRRAWRDILIKGLFLIFVCADLLAYQYYIFQQSQRLPSPTDPSINSLYVHRFEYEPMRVLSPVTERQNQSWEIMMIMKNTGKYAAAFNFMQMDNCNPTFRIDFISKNVSRLLTVPNLQRWVLACGTPKLHLYTNLIMVSDSDSDTTVYMYADNQNVVVLSPPVKSLKMESPIVNVSPVVEKTPTVLDFQMNEIKIQTDVTSGTGAWLVYFDAHHPYWKAWVDGKRVPIYKAFIGFKGVYLPQGQHEVKFAYGNFWLICISYFLVILGTLTAAVLMILVFRDLVQINSIKS